METRDSIEIQAGNPRALRPPLLFIIIPAVAALAAYLPVFVLTDKFFGDAYSYLTLAKSLEGGKYELVLHRNLKFLPLYPLAICLLNNLSLGLIGFVNSAKLLTMFSLCATSVLVFDIIRSHARSLQWAVIGGVACAWSPIFVFCSGNIISEPFLAMSAAACMASLARKKHLAAWAMAGFAILTRYEGFFLLPALVIADRRNLRRLASGFAIVLVMYAPWLWHVLTHLGEFIAFAYPAELVFQNDRTGANFLYDALLYLSPPIMLLGAAGICFWPRDQRWGAWGFVAGYFLIHLLWYFRSSRFVIPLVPFFVTGEMIAARKILSLRFSRPRLIKALLGLAIAAMIPFSAYYSGNLRFWRSDAAKQVVLHILEIDPRAAVLANIEPTLFYWYGGGDIYAWIDQDLKKSPYEWVADQYRDKGARYLVYSTTDKYSHTWFGDLDRKGYFSVRLERGGLPFMLSGSAIYFSEDRTAVVFGLQGETSK